MHQVCTATRSPCEDQALPLSWAPPSSAEGGKSPQGQPCCRLQWLRLSTFSAADRLTEFFREPRHHQMPGRSWRAGKASGDGKPAGPDRPLEKGVGGIRTGIIRCRPKNSEAMVPSSGAHEGLMCPLEKGVRGIEIVWDRVPIK